MNTLRNIILFLLGRLIKDIMSMHQIEIRAAFNREQLKQDDILTTPDKALQLVLYDVFDHAPSTTTVFSIRTNKIKIMITDNNQMQYHKGNLKNPGIQ